MTRHVQCKRGESGQALVLVIIVLLLSTLVVPPLLGVSHSSVRLAQIQEERSHRLYAADAGVEDALYKIVHRMEEDGTTHYSLANDPNDCAVDVTIESLGDEIYRITSAGTAIDGDTTTVESYVCFADYSYLTEYALATDGPVTMQPGTTVTGDVRYDYDGPPPDPAIKGDIDGKVTTDEPLQNWPETEHMMAFYWDDVDHLLPETSYTIDGTPDLMGPLYLDNGGALVNLTSKKNKWGQLVDTVYVKGDLKVNLKKNSEIDLNGCAIFVEGEIQMQPNTPLRGPGCLIATGDIQFQPNLMNDEFIFVMSLTGSIQAQPGSDFYGTLAAADGITIQPGGGIVNPGIPPDDLPLPGMDDETRQVSRLGTYTIK